MDLEAAIVVVLVVLSGWAVGPGLSMFEYICKAESLFRPYLHVYKGRRGERVLEGSVGFHTLLQAERDIWVCINGPAYLYYSKNTELGQVYEAQQFRVYSHTCEMHNVRPHSNATKLEYELHLMAVLLFGDPEDYRLPSIQTFTAPYFFDDDQYSKAFGRHYQNATSIVLIGAEQCALKKGESTPLTFQAENLPQPITLAPGSEQYLQSLPENDVFLCRLGFSELLAEADGKGDAEPEKKRMRALVNDEPITPTVFDAGAFDAKKAELEKKVEELEESFLATANWEKEYEDKVTAFLEPLEEQIAALDKKLAGASPAETKRLKERLQKLKAKKEAEEKKGGKFKELLLATKEAVEEVKEKKSQDFQDTAAKVDAAKVEQLRGELSILIQVDKVQEKKVEMYNAEIEAGKSRRVTYALFATFENSVAKAGQLMAQLSTEFKTYRAGDAPATGGNRKKPPRLIYDAKTEPHSFSIDYAKNPKACEPLPKLSGEEGECKKGKPKAEDACSLLKISMGQLDPWAGSSGNGVPDASWKKEVLSLISSIFTNACPYLPNRRKLLRQLNLFMGHYLNSPVHFNPDNPQTARETTMACENFRRWKMSPNPPSSSSSSRNKNKEERPSWSEIREVLGHCRDSQRRLTFRDKSLTYGGWVWEGRRRRGQEDAVVLLRKVEVPREQAEKEYVFNWVVDMEWRVFVTVLGICMPSYELNNPLITSKFYSLFTEDFLLPLRETWVSPQDNLIFQWILGEFVNGEAEMWAEQCMEASFYYSEREEYRPPRNLLVNCASEHNYFTSGRFAGSTGSFAR